MKINNLHMVYCRSRDRDETVKFVTTRDVVACRLAKSPRSITKINLDTLSLLATLSTTNAGGSIELIFMMSELVCKSHEV